MALALVALACGLSACGGGDVERAAQSARLESLEQELRQLRDDVGAIRSGALGSSVPSDKPAAQAFKLRCPQPWALEVPLGASLWTCRAAAATPDGSYAHCSVVSQPQVAIETKDYFEYAVSAAPRLLEARSFQDKPVKLNGADAFEGSFEIDPRSSASKIMGVVLPHGTMTYTITCVAPAAAFADYVPAFRQIIDSFAFN